MFPWAGCFLRFPEGWQPGPGRETSQRAPPRQLGPCPCLRGGLARSLAENHLKKNSNVPISDSRPLIAQVCAGCISLSLMGGKRREKGPRRQPERKQAAKKSGVKTKRSKQKPNKHIANGKSQKTKQTKRQPTETTAWNAGKKTKRSDRQHLFIPREEVELFLAVTLCFASPVAAVLLWVTITTSRRISEALRLRACDFHFSGGPHCDKPYVWFGERSGEEELPGLGKLGADEIVAKLSLESIPVARTVLQTGVLWEVLPCLEPYRQSHPEVFAKYKPFSRDSFGPVKGTDLLFPALKKSDTPWMTRQTAWNAVQRARTVMFDLTGHRRYNPDTKFNGMHVTVHGATRHTSAALLLYNPNPERKPPAEATILDVQQRSDVKTFRKHYWHTHNADVEQALSFAWVEPPFSPRPAPPVPIIDEPASSSGGSSPAPSTPTLTTTPKSPSRNSWRKQKRKAGKLAWEATAAAGQPGNLRKT